MLETLLTLIASHTISRFVAMANKFMIIHKTVICFLHKKIQGKLIVGSLHLVVNSNTLIGFHSQPQMLENVGEYNL